MPALATDSQAKTSQSPASQDTTLSAPLPQSSSSPDFRGETLSKRSPAQSRTDQAATEAITREEVVAAVQANPLTLKDYPEYQGDKTVVQAAVDRDGMALQYASANLRDDYSIARAAVRSDTQAMQFVSDDLRDDPSFVYGVVKNRESLERGTAALEFASERLRSDAKFMLSLNKLDSNSLFYADPKLLADGDFMRSAISANAASISFADKKLKEDRDWVRETVAKNGFAFQHLPQNYRNDPEIALSAVTSHGSMLRYVDDSLRARPEILSAAISSDPSALRYVPESVHSKPLFRELVEYAVGRSGTTLRYAGALSNDPKIAERAVKQSGLALEYVGGELRSKPEFENIARAAVREDGRALEYLPKEYSQRADWAVDAVSSRPSAASNVDPTVLSRPEVLRSFINNNVNAERELRRRVQPFPEEISKLCEQHAEAFKILDINHPERLTNSGEIIRNRYAVSSPDVQQQLRETLGEDYFKREIPDNRPLAVQIFADADERGSFQNNSLKEMSGAYRVVYYEMKNEKDFVRNLCEATVDAGQQADILVIAGHGNPEGIELSESEDGDERQQLDLRDRDLGAKVQGVVKRGGIVIVESCSTARDALATAEADTPAEVIHEYWPDTTLFAPDQDSFAMMEFDKDGHFVHPHFANSQTIILHPRQESSSAQRE